MAGRQLQRALRGVDAGAGVAGLAAVWQLGWDRLLYVLAALPLAYGLLRLLAPRAAITKAASTSGRVFWPMKRSAKPAEISGIRVKTAPVCTG